MRLRIARFGRVVERVGVLGGLDEFALTLQAVASAVAKEAIMSNELDLVALVALLDAVRADRIAGGRVAGVATIEVGHRERAAAGDLVQALAGVDRLLDQILVLEDLVSLKNRWLYIVCQSLESVTEDAVAREGGLCVGDLHPGAAVQRDAIVSQQRVRLRGDQHTALCVPEDLVTVQRRFA